MHSPPIYRSTFLLYSALGLAVLVLSGCDARDCLEIRDSGKKWVNVILISIDTLRADRLGCYGYERPTSPHLDRFARREAVLFEQAINTGGGTLPVHMSMLTSLPPTVHDVLPDNGNTLAPERITLAEQLREVGYTTLAFTGAGFTVAKFGFDQGFDLYDDAGGDFLKILPKTYAWLEQNRSEPFFLFLHTYDVHSDWKELPYDAPGGFNGLFTQDYSGDFDGCLFGECASELLALLNRKFQQRELTSEKLFTAEDLEFIQGLYDGGIAYVDQELGQLFRKLRGLGLYDESLIIVTSDHGEEFLEHGLFLHHQNYEEVARVPFLMKLPKSDNGGTRVPGLVSTLEVMPTVLDVVGVAPNPEVQGRSVLRLLEGGRAGRRWVYMAGGLEKLRTSRWSVLFDSSQTPVQLFDLEQDPGENQNLLGQYPDTATDLSLRYREVRRAQLAFRQTLEGTKGKAELSAEEIEDLRSLGYLN